MFLLLVLFCSRVNSEPPNLFPYRGIYLYPFAAVKFNDYLHRMRDSELNCVVVDFKSAEGYVTYDSKVERARAIGAKLAIINLENLVRACKEEGVLLIGRLVVFQDSILAWYNSGEYSIRGQKGEFWRDGHGKYWVDPCIEEVRAYNIELAKELASRGVREIQFDYIRFPSPTGDFRPYSTRCRDKESVIAKFLEEARNELSSFGVTITGDIFGCALWMRSLPHEGQNLELMAPFLDVIHPMLYPSHFPDKYEWSPNPREREYNIISGSIAKGAARLGNESTPLASRFVPWLQGFDWKAPGFGPDYIGNQISAAQSSGAWGYIVWHAASRYEPLWELLYSGSIPINIPREKTLQEKVREALEEIELSVELLEVQDGVVRVRLGKEYRRSPWEYHNALKRVATKIKERVPEVKEVNEG